MKKFPWKAHIFKNGSAYFVPGNGVQDLKLRPVNVEAEVVDPRIPNRLQGRKERHALDPGLFVPSLVFEATFRIVNYPFG